MSDTVPNSSQLKSTVGKHVGLGPVVKPADVEAEVKSLAECFIRDTTKSKEGNEKAGSEGVEITDKELSIRQDLSQVVSSVQDSTTENVDIRLKEMSQETARINRHAAQEIRRQHKTAERLKAATFRVDRQLEMLQSKKRKLLQSDVELTNIECGDPFRRKFHHRSSNSASQHHSVQQLNGSGNKIVGSGTVNVHSENNYGLHPSVGNFPPLHPLFPFPPIPMIPPSVGMAAAVQMKDPNKSDIRMIGLQSNQSAVKQENPSSHAYCKSCNCTFYCPKCK